MLAVRRILLKELIYYYDLDYSNFSFKNLIIFNLPSLLNLNLLNSIFYILELLSFLSSFSSELLLNNTSLD